MKKILIVLFVVVISGCSSVQYSDKSDFTQSGNELGQMSDNKNLTPEQKIILKHASTKLHAADKIARENEKLKQELVQESKQAGAGRLAYLIAGILSLGITAYIIKRITGLFS